MGKPAWSYGHNTWGIACERCSCHFIAASPTQPASCPKCGHVTGAMRLRASLGDGRIADGIIGALTENERRGVDYFDGLTNMQWSPMHGLWLEALSAGLPAIDMDSDPEFRVRFEVVRERPALSVRAKRSLLSRGLEEINPVRYIRLRVDSRDGRLTFAERIDVYVSHRKTVQAMFLALQSVLGRIPTSPRSRLAWAWPSSGAILSGGTVTPPAFLR